LNSNAPTSTDEPSAGESRIPRGIRVGALVLLAVLALIVGSAIATLAWNWMRDMAGRQETHSVRSGPDVVMAVRELARLESASYHMERVIELTSTQSRLFGLVEAEDSILLVASADVIAGIDLSEMSPEDVQIDHALGSARITLPPPRVLMTRLDSERTYVHSRRTDVLARRSMHLETEARREAERSLEASAIEAGILDRARAHSRHLIETLVRSLGYRDVEITFRETLR
jgi:hypothetical protein